MPAGLPGANMVGAQDGSWSHLCFIGLILATKPSHVGADVDGLACSQHHHTVSGWWTCVQCILTGAALSHRVAVVGDAFLGGVKPPGLDIYYCIDFSAT
jgi:hypothetical protein